MKCPKCGYLGFETVDRCRNCGYDFSLASSEVDRPAPSKVEGLAARNAEEPPPTSKTIDEGLQTERPSVPGRVASDLTLHDTPPPSSSALPDLDLGQQPSPIVTPSIDPIVIRGKSDLDLDRLIGVPGEAAPAAKEEPPRIDPVLNPPRPFAVSDEHTPLLDAVEAETEGASLPLFGRGRMDRGSEESPAVTTPRPAGPPLAVRRATPEVARPRTRSPRTPRRDEPPLSFPVEAPSSMRTPQTAAQTREQSQALHTASRIARLFAAVIDLALLAGICVGVLYLTLRIANLTFDDVRVLPVVPMGAFLILLVSGYLIAFTAAGGQTIGKMATGIKVVGEDGGPVDVSSAVLRLAGNAVNIATLGIAWLPTLFAADGRSIADRLAGTRVIRS